MLKYRAFVKNMNFWDVGEGAVDFLYDHWMGNEPIRLRLCIDGLSQGCMVINFWRDENWELPKALSVDGRLIREIKRINLMENLRDRLLIKDDGLKKALYTRVQSLDGRLGRMVYWGKGIWSSYFKPSMAIFN